MATVSEMISAVRDAGMAIQQIADALEVSLPTVYAWARGSSNPRAGMLAEITSLYENVVQGHSIPQVGLPPKSSTGPENDAASQLLVPVAASPAPAQPRRTRATSVAAEATPPPDRLAVAPPRQTGEALRFIHCADLHLDSPLKGLAKHDDARASWIQTATRRAFKRLVNMAIDNDVGFIVISGDLYDGQWQGMDTGYFMRGQLQRLAEKEIPVYAIAGNHDALSIISRSFEWPAGTHHFGEDAATIVVPNLPVAIHGRSFAERYQGKDFIESYPAARPGVYNVGLLHTSLTGNTAHTEYAPCTPAQLRSRNYEYWALGHVHLRQVVQSQPHIVFPGNIQGRGIDETGTKGCYVVTVDDTFHSEAHFVPLDDVRWECVSAQVAADGKGGIDAAIGVAVDAIQAALPQDDALLACRVTLTGSTPLHRRLLGRRGSIREDIAGAIDGQIGSRVWLEKIVIATLDPDDTPRRPPDIPRRAIEFIDQEFQNLVDTSPEDLIAADNDLRGLRDFLQPLEQLQPNCRDELASKERWQQVIEAARAILADALMTDDGEAEGAR